MSRARSVSQLLGGDGTFNATDVSGLAAVATSGSASDLSAGTLPIARIADSAITKAKIGYTGAVLQAGNVINAYGSNVVVDTTTMTTLHTLSVTPSKTNTRFLFYSNWMIYVNGASNFASDFRILANGSTVLNDAQDSHNPYFTNSSGGVMLRGAGMRYHDPGTTSTQSYAFQFAKSGADRAPLNFNHNSQYNSCIMWWEVQL